MESGGGNGFLRLAPESPQPVVAHIEMPGGRRLTVNGIIEEDTLVKMIRAVQRA